jgi:putative two-component system response regulator
MNEPQSTVMIVDDRPANLEILRSMLSSNGYRVHSFPNGASALRLAKRKPPDVILLDITMPEMDGYQVAKELKANDETKEIPVLFISARTGTEDKLRAFSAGGQDYVTKPFQVDEVLARVATHLSLRRLQLETAAYATRLEGMVAEKVEEISASQIATIRALARLAESRDDDTGKHVERTRTYCALLARELWSSGATSEITGEDWIETIFQAAALHDIGKVGISDHILLKPGQLTAEEFAIMKTHVSIGAQTLVDVVRDYPNNAFLRMGLDIVRTHHERWDGAGYAQGLSGKEIPLSARIMSVADVYDALRSRRPYKPSFPHEKCVEIITSGSATQFDPMVVDAFLGAAARMHDISIR